MKKTHIILLATFSLLSCVKDEMVVVTEPPVVVDYTQLVLNEINGTAATDPEKYIELYNKGAVAINLNGVQLTYGGAVTWTGDATQDIAPDGYFVVLGTKKGTNPGSMMSEGLSAGKNIKVQLLSPEDTALQTFQRGDGLGGSTTPTDQDFSRVTNGTGIFYYTPSVGTKGTTNGTVTTGLTPVNPS